MLQAVELCFQMRHRVSLTLTMTIDRPPTSRFSTLPINRFIVQMVLERAHEAFKGLNSNFLG